MTMPAPLEAQILGIRYEAKNIISLELRPVPHAATFPDFEPGAHIDLMLGNGLVRSYSLIWSSRNASCYTIGVLKDPRSRGGSVYVHDQLRVGMILAISPPRNHFKLDDSAHQSVLLAGGIGITPILGMLRRLMGLGRQVQLIYCARSRDDAAFLDEILDSEKHDVRLSCHFDDEQGAPPDVAALLAGACATANFYCCGPAAMISAFESACQTHGYANVHVERFAAIQSSAQVAAGQCEVTLSRSGKTVTVAAGRSILDCLVDAGVAIDHSCREGLCGACETRIVSGEAIHLDSILSSSEKAANKSMMLCVSQCKGDTLVLDL